MNAETPHTRLPLFLQITGDSAQHRDELANLLIKRLCRIYRIFLIKEVETHQSAAAVKIIHENEDFSIVTTNGGDYSDFEYNAENADVLDTFLVKARRLMINDAIILILDKIRYDSIVISCTKEVIKEIEPGLHFEILQDQKKMILDDGKNIRLSPDLMRSVACRVQIDFRGWFLAGRDN